MDKLKKTYLCCPHCVDDPQWHKDNAPDTHDSPCPTCEDNIVRAPAWDEGFEADTEAARNGWMPELINAHNPYRDVDS